MKKKAQYSYNERLFSSGIRKKLHTARFYWLANSLTALNFQCIRILELGCFDGKVLDYLPMSPARYVGLDANWEGGLNIAIERWKSDQRLEFRECHTPQEMALNGETFDISICMDTLEHVPPEMVDSYLLELSEATQKYFFVTVPNEKGLVFFLKYVTKIIFSGDAQNYTMSEFINAILGRMEKVARKEHKGFDYEMLIESISKYFEIYTISGYPVGFLPPCLNFGVGVIGKKK
jgi:2-polyprenyl-3-methyl-5-hydroxy-6-metoxy-1,4-benzoquinol methylase